MGDVAGNWGKILEKSKKERVLLKTWGLPDVKTQQYGAIQIRVANIGFYLQIVEAVARRELVYSGDLLIWVN